MIRNYLAVLLALVISTASATAHASILLVDTVHNSDAGGVWNNTFPGNWAIWYHLAGSPNDVNPRPFVNEPDPLAQDVTIPDGTTTYVLYKNSYNTVDVNNVFSFQNGALTGNITVPGAGAYQTNNGPVPTFGSPPSLTLGNITVRVTSFGWYNPTVFNKDFVGPNQALGAQGTLDDVGLVTFQVVPEPSSLALGIVGSLMGLGFWRRKRVGG